MLSFSGGVKKLNIEKIDFGGYRIGIPIPFPMKYIYCYLYKHEDDFVLIDTGINNEVARNAWQQAFKELQINPKNIKTIYLTHFHPDHSGLCGWMQQLTGAVVFMHKVDMEMMEKVWMQQNQQSNRVGEMARQHGTPQALSEKIVDHMDNLRKFVLPLPKIQPISEEVEFAGEKWKVLLTPGHSGGHICFFQEQAKVLISGDHILDKISPNISVWPGASQAPLHEYIHSLQQVKGLGVRLALPAHGRPIESVNERIEELLDHHAERLSQMEKLAQYKTAYEIAERIFAEKKLTPHQWRFAIAETIAHLNYLTTESRLKRIDSNPIIFDQIK